eukprot:460187_1
MEMLLFGKQTMDQYIQVVKTIYLVVLVAKWIATKRSIYTSCKNNIFGRLGGKVDSNKTINKIPFLSQLSIKKMVSGYCCSIAICNDGSVYSTGHGERKGDNGLGEKGKTNES